jgi:hypothetical protein
VNHVWLSSPEADGSWRSLCRAAWAARADLVPERDGEAFCGACAAVDRERTPAERRDGVLPRPGIVTSKSRTPVQCAASTPAPTTVEVWPRVIEIRPGNIGATPLTDRARDRRRAVHDRHTPRRSRA